MANIIEEQLERVVKEFKVCNNEMRDVVAKSQAEIRETGHSLLETNARMQSVEHRYDQAQADLKGLKEELSKAGDVLSKSNQNNEMLQKRIDELEAAQKKYGSHSSNGSQNFVSPGHRFTQSAEFKSYNPDKKGDSVQFNVKGLHNGNTFQGGGLNIPGGIEGAKTSPTIDGAGGDTAMRSQWSTFRRQDMVFDPLFRQIHLRQYLNVINVDPNIQSVSYIVEDDFTNNAGYWVDTQVDPALKPLSGIDTSLHTASRSIIAHGMRITRQLAKDAPRLMNHIDNRLIQCIYHKEDADLIFSDGSSGSTLGIIHNTGIQTYNRGRVGDTNIDALRRAQTQLQLYYYSASLTVLSPQDWEVIELQKDSQNRYLWVGVQGAEGQAIMWRVPVFVSTLMQVGKFLTGDFTMGCTLYDCQQAYVQIYDQHSDWVLRNQLLALAESEVIFTTDRPHAFVYGTLPVSGSGSGEAQTPSGVGSGYTVYGIQN